MTDAETTAAIDAIARLVRNRDSAMRDGEDYADPEVFAAECVTVMRGYGWRHNEALAPPRPAVVTPGTAGRREELLAPLRAHLDELNAAQKAEREAGAA